ncbi:MAG TPA: hypothetical protein VER12_03700 [Polyangiaceae bacterium]|nr:hypothetical protein [Polyangiaceae bacterium]
MQVFDRGLAPAGFAWTLAAVLWACGGTSTNEHAPSNAGATTDANADSAGNTAGGGRPNGGVSGSNAAAGAREPSGGAAGLSQGTGAQGTGAAAQLCPGSSLDPARANTAQCSTADDCINANPQLSNALCQVSPPKYECGGAAPFRECSTDPECGNGRICKESSCGNARCEDACPTKGCAEFEDCTDGRCTPKACNAVGALPCGAGTECQSVNGGEAACRAILCTAGVTCPATWDCAFGPNADAHGCVQRTCKSSADCACGYCVSGRCEPTPGYCFNYAPPP